MKKNSFINGALIATLAIVITKFLGIIYVIPFYAIIGEENIALYGYAYTIYNLFLALSTVGIPPAMSKLISEYNSIEEASQKTSISSSGIHYAVYVKYKGRITNIYPALFTITPNEEYKGKTAFSYSEYMCGIVDIMEIKEIN